LYYLVPLAYDRSLDHAGKGTIARCQALGNYARDLCNLSVTTEDEFVFIATAGFTKESPLEPTQEHHESLAFQIGNYARSKSFRAIAKPLAWGTYQELFEALGLICNEHSLILASHPVQILGVNHIGPPKICISTNLGHMPRVRLVCFFLRHGKMKWTHLRYAEFQFITARHSFTPKEWAQETIKFFIYLYRFLFKKW